MRLKILKDGPAHLFKDGTLKGPYVIDGVTHYKLTHKKTHILHTWKPKRFSCLEENLLMKVKERSKKIIKHIQHR